MTDDMRHPTDVHVGLRVRRRRKEMRLSQEVLASAVGITFQQVQKYERGTNRVSASRLLDIAKVLNVSIGYFFSGIDSDVTSFTGDDADRLAELATVPEGAELAATFPKLTPAQRESILGIVRAMNSSDPP